MSDPNDAEQCGWGVGAGGSEGDSWQGWPDGEVMLEGVQASSVLGMCVGQAVLFSERDWSPDGAVCARSSPPCQPPLPRFDGLS